MRLNSPAMIISFAREAFGMVYVWYGVFARLPAEELRDCCCARLGEVG